MRRQFIPHITDMLKVLGERGSHRLGYLGRNVAFLRGQPFLEVLENFGPFAIRV